MQSSSKTYFYPVIIIGGGAAGLMCAAELSKKKIPLLVLEKNQRLGSKILISGGGRCNFTNLDVSAGNYRSENVHFVKSALSQYGAQDFFNLVQKHRIAYCEKKVGQLFCQHSSKEILQLLISEINSAYAELKTSIKIEKIEFQNEHYQIHLKSGEIYQSQLLVIASGGLSYPRLGASGFGYQVAQQFGHSIIPTRPALDGFVLSNRSDSTFSALSGNSFVAKVSIGKRDWVDSILITHQGLSGPAILQASLYWEKDQEVKISLFLNEKEEQEAWQLLKKEIPISFKSFIKGQKKNDSAVLPWKTRWPNAFIDWYLKFKELDEEHLPLIPQKGAYDFFCQFKDWKLTPLKTVGYEKAEVTLGGVDTSQISSKTMESKLKTGLYFIGEVLDVTGDLGGYNFQWAWSSAWVAAQNIVKGFS